MTINIPGPIIMNFIVLYYYLQAGKPIGETKDIGKTAPHNPKLKSK